MSQVRAGTDFTLAQCAVACRQALTENGKRAYDDSSGHHGGSAGTAAYQGMLEMIVVLGDCTGPDNAQECFARFKRKLEDAEEVLDAVIFAMSDQCFPSKPTAAAASGSSGSSSVSAGHSGPPVQTSAELFARIAENRAKAMAIKRQRIEAGEVTVDVVAARALAAVAASQPGVPNPSSGASAPATVSKAPDWQFEKDAVTDEWKSMGNHLSGFLELAYQRGHEDESFTLESVPYFINLRNMFQENRKTGTVRRIRRIIA